jgi:hypothetical protein
MKRREPAMTQAEAAAQAELREIVTELELLRSRLLEIIETLPKPPGEVENEDEMDVATEIRSVIECVLTDNIRPAIRDLRTAASYGSRGS